MEQAHLYNTLNFVYSARTRGGPDARTRRRGARTRKQVNLTSFASRIEVYNSPVRRPRRLHLHGRHRGRLELTGRSIQLRRPLRGNTDRRLGTNPSQCDGLFCRVNGSTEPAYAAKLGAPSGMVVSIAAVTDGLSNTAAWSERIRGIGCNQDPAIENDSSPPRRTITSSPTSPTRRGHLADVEGVYTNCLNAPVLRRPRGRTHAAIVGWMWWGGQYNSGRYNHTMPPNSKLSAPTPTTTDAPRPTEP